MRSSTGIFLLVCLNGVVIFLNIIIAIHSFGVIVNGSFSVELSNQIMNVILTWFSFFGLLSVITNFLILKHLIKVKKSLLISLLISLSCFLISLPFVYVERDDFLENGEILSSSVPQDCISSSAKYKY